MRRAGSIISRTTAAVPAPRLSTNLNSYTVSRFVLEPPQPLTDLAIVTLGLRGHTLSVFSARPPDIGVLCEALPPGATRFSVICMC